MLVSPVDMRRGDTADGVEVAMRRFSTAAANTLGSIGVLLVVLALAVSLVGQLVFDTGPWPAVITLCTGLASLGLAYILERFGRGSRRRRLAARRAGLLRPASDHVEGTAPILLVENGPRRGRGGPSRRDGMYELKMRRLHLVVAGNRTHVGPDRACQTSVSANRAKLLENGETVVTASREARGAREWLLETPVDVYSVMIEEVKTKSRSSTRTFLWQRDRTRRTHRHATINRTTGGDPLAEIDLEYSLDVRPQLGRSSLRGRFSGTLTAHEPVPIAVVALALRIALWNWAERTPRVGEWTVDAVAG